MTGPFGNSSSSVMTQAGRTAYSIAGTLDREAKLAALRSARTFVLLAPIITYASIFSGAGLTDLGAVFAGLEVVWQCEIDPACRYVLDNHFPHVYKSSDVRQVKQIPFNKFPKYHQRLDVLHVGFPCQDVSSAGNGEGFEGERSGLIKEVIRLLKDAIKIGKPVETVVFENVPGITHIRKDEKGNEISPALLKLMDMMEELGYMGFSWRKLSASAFGLPLHRDRFYLVASFRGDPRDITHPLSSLTPCKGCPYGTTPCSTCYYRRLETRITDSNVTFVLQTTNLQSKITLDCVGTMQASGHKMAVIDETFGLRELTIPAACAVYGAPLYYFDCLANYSDNAEREAKKMLGNGTDTECPRFIFGNIKKTMQKYCPAVVEEQFMGELIKKLKGKDWKRPPVEDAPKPTCYYTEKTFPDNGFALRGYGVYAIVGSTPKPFSIPYCPLRECINLKQLPLLPEDEAIFAINRLKGRGYNISSDLELRVEGVQRKYPDSHLFLGTPTWVELKLTDGVVIYWPAEEVDPRNPPKGYRIPPCRCAPDEVVAVLLPLSPSGASYLKDSKLLDDWYVKVKRSDLPSAASVKIYADEWADAFGAYLMQAFGRDSAIWRAFSLAIVQFCELWGAGEYEDYSSSTVAGILGSRSAFAARTNKKIFTKCGKCNGCMAKESRECFGLRMENARITGHSGAFYASLGSTLIGARLEFQIGGETIEGNVTDYDESDFCHRIETDVDHDWWYLWESDVWVSPEFKLGSAAQRHRETILAAAATDPENTAVLMGKTPTMEALQAVCNSESFDFGDTVGENLISFWKAAKRPDCLSPCFGLSNLLPRACVPVVKAYCDRIHGTLKDVCREVRRVVEALPTDTVWIKFGFAMPPGCDKDTIAAAPLIGHIPTNGGKDNGRHKSTVLDFSPFLKLSLTKRKEVRKALFSRIFVLNGYCSVPRKGPYIVEVRRNNGKWRKIRVTVPQDG